jgi:chemotaxis protein CheC
MSSPYSEIQLDALRELANIGSGTAATALSSMLGRPVDVSIPAARALPLADAVEAVGDPEADAKGVVIPVRGDMTGVGLLLFGPDDAATLCRLLGVDPDSEWAESALGEIGNIVGTSYLNAMGAMTMLELRPAPPLSAHDMLGALVASVVMEQLDGVSDTTLLLDSELLVEGESCAMSFLLVPAAGGVHTLLERLGLA